MPICVICGKEGSGYLCDSCREAVDIEELIIAESKSAYAENGVYNNISKTVIKMRKKAGELQCYENFIKKGEGQ